MPFTIADAPTLRKIYAKADPYPHVVLDDALPDNVALQVSADIEKIEDRDWQHDDHDHQRGKRWCCDPGSMTDFLGATLRGFNDPKVLAFLSAVTGIPDLIPDNGFMGGGVHQTKAGGHLGVHADFNIHPEKRLHRRINLLLFFCPQWRPEYGGELELWEPSMRRCARYIAPLFNRAVIFSITDKAFHGAPAPWSCPTPRNSLALYYYTKDRPAHEKSAFHWAAWQETPK